MKRSYPLRRWRLGYFPQSARVSLPHFGKYIGTWGGVGYTVWFFGPFELWRYDV